MYTKFGGEGREKEWACHFVFQWSVWREGRQRSTTVFIPERPGCFAGLSEATQSGRSPSLRKKGGWKRLQVFRLYIHNTDNQQACSKINN
jgi:hypothetical protein